MSARVNNKLQRFHNDNYEFASSNILYISKGGNISAAILTDGEKG